jgi:citrate synthase
MTTTNTPDVIRVVGYDLVDDLIGKVTFTEMVGLLLRRGSPLPPAHADFIDAVLVTFADHGVTPSSMAARLTLLGAPEAMQAAVAAGLSGAGSRFLGTLENSARILSEAVAQRDDAPAQIAADIVAESIAAGSPVVGIGHPEHKVEDPRVPVLLRIARERELVGRCTEVLISLPDAAQRRTGNKLPVNAAGLAGALIADMGYTPSFARGLALIARAAGLVGQLLDEELDSQARPLWDRERRRANADENGENTSHE